MLIRMLFKFISVALNLILTPDWLITVPGPKSISHSYFLFISVICWLPVLGSVRSDPSSSWGRLWGGVSGITSDAESSGRISKSRVSVADKEWPFQLFNICFWSTPVAFLIFNIKRNRDWEKQTKIWKNLHRLVAKRSSKKNHSLSLTVKNIHNFGIHIFVENGIVMTKLILGCFFKTLNACISCIVFLLLYWLFILTLPQN